MPLLFLLSFFALFVYPFNYLIQNIRDYKSWDKDGLGEEKLVAALRLVLAGHPVSARQACRQVFGEGYPNVHQTLGNLYKRKFGESIALAKKLSLKVREQRLQQVEDEWIIMGRPGNPAWKPYLTRDEEKLIASFLQMCHYMHMPFNRDAFKVSCLCARTHTHARTTT